MTGVTLTTGPDEHFATDDLAGALRHALGAARAWAIGGHGAETNGPPGAAVGVLDGQDVTDIVSGDVDEAAATDVARRLAGDGAVDATDGADGAEWRARWALVGDGRQAFAIVRGRTGVEVSRLDAALLAVVRAVLLATDRRRSDQLAHLLATARRVTESLELATVLTSIVDDASTLLHADSGDMLLWDRATDTLRVVAASRYGTALLGMELTFGQGLSTQAILAQRTLWVDDYSRYEHRARQLDGYDFGAVICAPLVFRGAAIGAINLHRVQGGPRFGPPDGDLLAAFADHAAIAIDHARRYENEVRLGRDLAETNRELTRSLGVQQRLAEQVLTGGGPAGIAEVLARDLGRSVVILDGIRRVIAGASPGGGDTWEALADVARVDVSTGRDVTGRDGGGQEPFSVAVRVGRDVAGYLVLSAEDDLDPVDRALIDVAVTGVALEFAKVRASLEVEGRLRGEAITDLLAGTYPDEDAIAGRTARSGTDLTQPHDLLVVDLVVANDAVGGTALDAIREGLASQAPRSVVAVHAGTVVVLAAHAPRGGIDARALAAAIQDWVAGNVASRDGRVSVALGGTCRVPDDYAPAFQTSREALELMRKLGRAGVIVGARELGPYGLILRASSREDLETFARERLGPLLDQETRHGAELLQTLRIYLEEGRVQRRVAARSFIHVNTVAYRVNRIQELLGVRLADPSSVFDLTLALRIMDVVDDPIPAGGGARGRPPVC